MGSYILWSIANCKSPIFMQHHWFLSVVRWQENPAQAKRMERIELKRSIVCCDPHAPCGIHCGHLFSQYQHSEHAINSEPRWRLFVHLVATIEKVRVGVFGGGGECVWGWFLHSQLNFVSIRFPKSLFAICFSNNYRDYNSIQSNEQWKQQTIIFRNGWRAFRILRQFGVKSKDVS